MQIPSLSSSSLSGVLAGNRKRGIFYFTCKHTSHPVLVAEVTKTGVPVRVQTKLVCVVPKGCWFGLQVGLLVPFSASFLCVKGFVLGSAVLPSISWCFPVPGNSWCSPWGELLLEPPHSPSPAAKAGFIDTALPIPVSSGMGDPDQSMH